MKGRVITSTTGRKNAPLNKGIRKFYKEGKTVRIKHAINGEKINGSALWYVLENNTFLHSSYLSVQEQVPVKKKEILVTADDIGVVEKIDDGAIEALQKGWINSIAVLVNKDPNDTVYLDNLKTRLEHLGDEVYNSTHIGLHFTATSGKPLSKLNLVPKLVKGDRFKLFGKLTGELDGRDIDAAYVDQYIHELEKQYERFCHVFGRQPDHLTSHHDSHTYKRDLFERFHRFAEAHQVPVRSHSFIPNSNRVMFDLFGVSDVDILSVRRMGRYLEEWDGLPFEALTADIDTRFYGPPLGKINKRRRFTKERDKKISKLKEKILRDFLCSDSESLELLIHLMKLPPGECYQRDLMRRESEFLNGYKGIKVNYFDGRCAEFRALEKIGSWSDKPEVQLMQR